MDVIEYAWLVRLSKILQDAGVTKNQVEEIISDVPLYCFKAGIDVESLVDLLKMYKYYLDADSSDPAQTNFIFETHRIAVEKCKIAQSSKLEDVLKVILTDDKVRELNACQLCTAFQSEQIVERIIDVTRNPSGYQDLFFGA